VIHIVLLWKPINVSDIKDTILSTITNLVVNNFDE